MSNSTQIKYLHNTVNKDKYVLNNCNNKTLPFPSINEMQYKESVEKHTASGKRDFDFLNSLFEKHGFILKEKTVLEFGCSNSRVLRHFEPYVNENTFWGCDINSKTITWCLENLSPPFNYFVNTTQPHLPFKDGTFDFIYAYSIFTHIDDLFFTWLLELKRNIKKGGYLYITIHDENSVNFAFKRPQRVVGKFVKDNANLFKEFLNGKFNMVAINRSNGSQVFLRREFFINKVKQLGFSVEDTIFHTMGGHQTAFLLKVL